jgi:hypothetical protein
MPGRGAKFASIEGALVFDNGVTVAFTVTTGTGKQLRVNCKIAEPGEIFSFLGHAAKAASELRNVPSTLQPRDYLVPVPAQGMGLQVGERPAETLLATRLSGFDVASQSRLTE